MGNRSGVLMLLGMLSLGMVAFTPTVSGAYTYSEAWTAQKSTRVFSYSLTVFSDWLANNTFTMYSWEAPGNKLLLVDPANSLFLGDLAISYAGSNYTATAGGNSISLGAMPLFGFSFNGVDKLYDLEIFESGWKLTNADTKSVISVQGNIQPVPIPGTALLLASSLLGLVGIGVRKKHPSLV